MDEAWVANALLEPTWTGLFHYQEWLQTTPPGFLVLAAWGVQAFGHSPAAFRLLPLIAGLVGLGAVAALSRRLSPAFGLLAVLLVALSPTAADYSRMLKQYSVELAVAALLILVTWRYVERPTGGRFAALAAALGVGLTCAYGAVFTVGGVLALTSPVGLMLIRPERREARRPALGRADRRRRRRARRRVRRALPAEHVAGAAPLLVHDLDQPARRRRAADAVPAPRDVRPADAGAGGAARDRHRGGRRGGRGRLGGRPA